MTKLLAIGLDGCSWKIVSEMMKRGELPNFSKISDNGASGLLESTIPPITIPAWITMFTGLNPGKLGVCDFSIKDSNYNFNVFNSSYWKGKAIWDLTKKKSIIINVPGTYPPWKINGLMITGLLTPERKNFTYPKEIEKEIGVEYVIEADHNLKSVDVALEKRIELVKKLYKKKHDLFILVIRALDATSHISDDIENYKKRIKLIDHNLGEIMKIFKDYNIMITSDHGMKHFEKWFYINKWLEKEGFLTINKLNKKERILKFIMQNINRFLEKYDLKTFKKILVKLYEKKKIFEFSIPFDPNRIEWKKTKAFSIGGGISQYCGIYINDKSFIKGIITDKKNVINEIIDKLKKVKDPETNKTIVENVWKREEIYRGDKIKNLPEIIVKTSDKYCIHPDIFSNYLFSVKKKFLNHSYNGTFMAYGPDIKKGKKITTDIINIAPTVLYMMGEKIPKNMDGRVLKEIFIYNATKKVKYEKNYRRTEGKKLNKEVEDMIKKKLRELGYAE